MKRILLILIWLGACLPSWGAFRSLQDRIPRELRPVSLFTKVSRPAYEAVLRPTVKRFDLLQADPALLRELSAQDAPLALQVPLGAQWVTVLLVKNEGLDGLLVTAEDGRGRQPYAYRPGSYYHGVVEGQAGTVAAISFFGDDIIGMISTPDGNWVIGRSNQLDPVPGEYVIYNDRDLLVHDLAPCAFTEAFQSPAAGEPGVQTEAYTTKCVKFYWECDFKCYQDFGNSVANVTNFATGLYNLVSTLYLNDSVLTGLQQVNVWTVSDPYVGGSTTSQMLNLFSTQMGNNGFSGDLAHLLSRRSAGGGIAWLDVLCDMDYYKTAVSASLSTTLTPLPTYSWNSEVVTHEIGHNLGSPHTHACAWNGNNTRIDNCAGNFNVQYQEGNCNSFPPNPVGGGTIMSYCHLQAVGINFNLGFGPQPGTLIRNKVNAAACLGSCLACSSAIVLTGTVSDPLYESSDFITTSGQTTVQSTATVKLDADSGSGYVLFAPGSNNDFFEAAPSTTGAMFVAQAYNGCDLGEPFRPAQPGEQPNEERSGTVTVYPNPTTGWLYLNIPGSQSGTLNYLVTSTDGRILQRGELQVAGGRYGLDLSALAPGLYLLRLQTGQSIRFVRE